MPAETFEQAFGRAFGLAFFLHGERGTAWAVATEAFAQLKVAVVAQRKRLYYLPRGGRSKVELSELQLLQRLVLIASDPHEREGEAAGRASREDFARRFVKHLVRVTMKRNSFHVALGVARVLHDYPTPAAMDLYGLLLDDPGRNPDDPYYRARKRVLLGELAERFGPRLELVRGPGGEDRFASAPPQDFAAVVRQALAAFAPWGARCDLPAGWSAGRGGIPDLAVAVGRDASEVDLRRIFAVLHPPMLDRLLAALHLPPAAERLTVPAFHLERQEPPAAGPAEPEELDALPTAAEIVAAQAELARRAQARRQPGPAWLAVRVDGAFQGRVGLDGEPCALALPEGAERIEIARLPGARRAPEPLARLEAPDAGRTEVLAVHLLGSGEPLGSADPQRFTVALAAGRRLEIEIGPADGKAPADGAIGAERPRSAPGDRESGRPAAAGGRVLRVAYRRTAWRRGLDGVAALPRWVRPAFAAAAAALALMLTLPFLLRQGPSSPSPQGPAPPAARAGGEPTPTEVTRGPGAVLGPPGGSAGEPAARAGRPVLWLEPAPAAVDPALAAALGRALARQARHGTLALGGQREAADLALRWLPGAGGGPVLALVARDGRILWRQTAAPEPARDPKRRAAAWVEAILPHLHSPSSTKPAQ